MSTTDNHAHDQRRRIRARMAATGERYNVARRALAAEAPAPTPERSFVNAPDLDWSRTWGHHMMFSKPGRKTFTARVLPPEPGSRRRPWRLRVLDDGATEPRVIDARIWQITPDPAGLTAFAGFGYGQRKRDPYTPMPDGFATASMLREQHRKEPAKGQHPAGIWHGKWGESPIYWIADAVDLPPLKGKAAARWQANRTCAECGVSAAEPWPVDSRTGKRNCGGCKRARSRVLWRDRRHQETTKAAAWAAAVLADPATAVADMSWDVPDQEHPVRRRRRYTVQTPEGDILFTSVLHEPYAPETEEVRQQREMILDQAAALEGRRLIFGDHDIAVEFARDLQDMAVRDGRDRLAITIGRGDALEWRYRWWWDRSDEVGWVESVEKASTAWWTVTPPWGDSRDLTCEQVRTLVQDMAARRLPETANTLLEETR